MSSFLPIFGCSDFAYPTELLFGICTDAHDNIIYEIPKEFPFGGEWGTPEAIIVDDSEDWADFSVVKIKIAWLSVREGLFYFYEGFISDIKLSYGCPERVVIGMAPKGGLAIWFQNDVESRLSLWDHGLRTEIPTSLFRTVSPGGSIKEVCDFHIENIQKRGISVSKKDDLSFDKRMKQYNLRYIVQMNPENSAAINTVLDNNKVQIENVCLKLYNYDGSYDKTGNSLELLKNSGMPNKINLNWIFKGQYYLAYWIVSEGIFEVFDRFYGAHPETKADFIIRIDAEAKKYELALYRQGLKEPVVIPESAYQLIVFKNKFEDYRSENYNQPRGAWIW